MENWKSLFEERVLVNGEKMVLNDQVKYFKRTDHICTASIAGRTNCEVITTWEQGKLKRMHCNCPASKGGRNCAHMAALLYYRDLDISAVSQGKSAADALKEWIRREKAEKSAKEQAAGSVEAAEKSQVEGSARTEKDKLARQEADEAAGREQKRLEREERKRKKAEKEAENKRRQAQALEAEQKKRREEEERRAKIREEKALEAKRKEEKRKQVQEAAKKLAEQRKKEEEERRKEQEKRAREERAKEQAALLGKKKKEERDRLYTLLGDSKRQEEDDWDGTGVLAELEDYRYYQADRIENSAKMTEKRRKEGELLLKNKKIRIDRVSSGYDSQSGQAMGVILATANPGKNQFPVKMYFSREKVISGKCECPECQKFYYSYFPHPKVG